MVALSTCSSPSTIVRSRTRSVSTWIRDCTNDPPLMNALTARARRLDCSASIRVRVSTPCCSSCAMRAVRPSRRACRSCWAWMTCESRNCVASSVSSVGMANLGASAQPPTPVGPVGAGVSSAGSSTGASGTLGPGSPGTVVVVPSGTVVVVEVLVVLVVVVLVEVVSSGTVVVEPPSWAPTRGAAPTTRAVSSSDPRSARVRRCMCASVAVPGPKESRRGSRRPNAQRSGAAGKCASGSLTVSASPEEGMRCNERCCSPAVGRTFTDGAAARGRGPSASRAAPGTARGAARAARRPRGRAGTPGRPPHGRRARRPGAVR